MMQSSCYLDIVAKKNQPYMDMQNNLTESWRLPAALQILIDYQLINPEKAMHALQQAGLLQQNILHYLVYDQLMSAEQIAKTLAQHFRLPFINLASMDNPALPLHLLSEKLIRTHRILPLSLDNQRLVIAMDYPDNPQCLKDIQFYTGLQPSPAIVALDVLATTLTRVLHQKDTEGLELYGTSQLSVTEPKQPLPEPNRDDPIIQFVDNLLLAAIEKKASDVHFEPYEQEYRIRFRQDGLLTEAGKAPLTLSSRIASRLKIMAELDITEKRLPQDGRFTYETPLQQGIDCRVSTCPTADGEKIVIRLLYKNQCHLELGSLGFTDQQRATFMSAIHKPQGLILVTGPTGSGKSLTLYSALNHINCLEKNISTVEDPVEIKLHGINQVAINPKAGLNFANILRALLRQDPDVIMIGEIRDQETAEIALNAALTGHLVFATLHANNTIDALTRLQNLHASAFNMSACITLILAQRLVRVLCPACKAPRTDLEPDQLHTPGFKDQEATLLTLYKAVGCNQCQSGYRGRVGLFEILPITKSFQSCLVSQHTSQQLFHQAQQEGLMTLYQAGLDKTRQGLTSLEEIKRVCIAEEYE